MIGRLMAPSTNCIVSREGYALDESVHGGRAAAINYSDTYHLPYSEHPPRWLRHALSTPLTTEEIGKFRESMGGAARSVLCRDPRGHVTSYSHVPSRGHVMSPGRDQHT